MAARPSRSTCGKTGVDPLGYAESLAAFRRKQREADVSAEAVAGVLALFEQEWQALVVVELSSDLDYLIRGVLDRHALRGADAVHLASCLLLPEHIGGSPVFGCWDGALLQAARHEDLTTVP